MSDRRRSKVHADPTYDMPHVLRRVTDRRKGFIFILTKFRSCNLQVRAIIIDNKFDFVGICPGDPKEITTELTTYGRVTRRTSVYRVLRINDTWDIGHVHAALVCMPPWVAWRYASGVRAVSASCFRKKRMSTKYRMAYRYAAVRILKKNKII